MASDGGGEEELALERQLEQQLDEQKSSLDAVNEALVSDPSNPELIAVHEELISVIKDAEEGLLHLKRSRLLKQMDSIFPGEPSASLAQDVEAEPLDLSQVEPEPLDQQVFPVGSKCRFRHTDGRWYNGHVVGIEGNDNARISFLNPTSENTVMCKFFLKQRCRFDSNCRMSHGFIIPMSSLKPYTPTMWHESLVGSAVLAATGPTFSLWKQAELESWDDKLKLAQVVFREDRTYTKLGPDAISISEYAIMSDDDEQEEEYETSSTDKSDSSDGELKESGHQGLGFLETTKLQRGVQTETAVFAKWENHTRGIASKMMANMGYREGMGLGASGQGMIDPIPVKVLPAKQSLDHAVATSETSEGGDRSKKRSRGGKRKRDKKYAELARAAKSEEEQKPDVFSFINNQLANGGQENSNGSGSKAKKESCEGDNRRSLVAYDDEVKELRNRVGKLADMARRNRKDKVVYEAAMRKLEQTRKDLADAEATHASASNAIVSKEKEKKWLKF